MTRWCVRFAEDLTVLAQQLMRLDQRIVAPGQRWREYKLCVPVRLAIVLFFDDEPDPAQHAKAVGVERKRPRLPIEHEYFVRARLADADELHQRLARLRERQAQHVAEIAVPTPQHELGRLAHAIDARVGSHVPA